jgi:hypothetical protein
LPNIANTSDPLNRLFLTEQARQILALQEAQVKSCYEHMDVEDLKYMGTATVVRDIDFMTQVLDGKDAKMYVLNHPTWVSLTDSRFTSNYWGGSYGTILGAYLVNMWVPFRDASLHATDMYLGSLTGLLTRRLMVSLIPLAGPVRAASK